MTVLAVTIGFGIGVLISYVHSVAKEKRCPHASCLAQKLKDLERVSYVKGRKKFWRGF